MGNGPTPQRLRSGISIKLNEPNLDPHRRFAHDSAMGKQYNKGIKKRRRLRYLKRKKDAKKSGSAPKPAAG